jgi:hypothetical protein
LAITRSWIRALKLPIVCSSIFRWQQGGYAAPLHEIPADPSNAALAEVGN